MDRSQDCIDAARQFARFFTREALLLNEAFLGSRFTLTEGRVLFELSRRGETTASALAHGLNLDRGYLSRILKTFDADGLLSKRSAAGDARQTVLSLSPAGREAFAPLDHTSGEQWRKRLAHLPEDGRGRLVRAMRQIETLLGEPGTAATPARLRQHQAGDLGWVARRQGLLYAQEYGWDDTFEALVAEILTEFVRNHDPARERGWIAEGPGGILGSVYCVAQSDEVAKLRLLYVEPEARGTGLGSRLVAECIGFARERGYRRMTLWTNDCLDAARHIYVRAGFRLVAEEKHHSFGHDLVGQNWDLDL